MRLTGLVATVMASIVFCSVVRADGLVDDYRQPYFDAFKGKKVGFVPLSSGIDLVQAWTKIWQSQADRFGYTLEVRDPNWNAAVGAQAVEDLIAEKVDILILHPIDLQTYARLAKKAQDAGIYVIDMQQRNAFQTEAFVGADFIDISSKEVDAIAKRCGPGTSGKIAFLQGALNAPASLYQINGATEQMKKYPNLQLVANQAADWDSAKANAVTKVILQQHPDLCGIIGFWDGQDIGAAAAVEEAGLKGKVAIATNGAGTTEACKNLKNGTFTDYVDFDVRGGGRDVNTLIRFLLQSKPKPGELKASLYVPSHVSSMETVKDSDCYAISDLDERGGP